MVDTLEFDLSDEETLLKGSVDRFCADLAERRAEPRAAWTQAAELGLAALLVPEDAGGLGGTPETMSLLFEAIGRTRADLPALSAAVLGATALAAAPAAGDALEALATGETIVALAALEAHARYDVLDVRTTGGADGSGLTGCKIAVLDAPTADLFVISAATPEGFALVLVPADAPGLQVRPWTTLDGRAAADLSLENVSGTLLLTGEAAAESLNLALDRARLMQAAEILGLMETGIALTDEYLKTRKQFGKPLSSFQTLTHRMADMFVAAENARSMVYRGLSRVGSAPAERAAAVSATMAAVFKDGEFVLSQAIQLHGGIGMAEETPVGHYYKRFRVIARTFGDRRFHMNRYIALTAGGRKDSA